MLRSGAQHDIEECCHSERAVKDLFEVHLAPKQIKTDKEEFL